MSYVATSVLVVSSAQGSLLTPERVREIVRIDDLGDPEIVDPVEVSICSAEAPELALWLDQHLAWIAMVELLSPRSNPTVILVEDGTGSHGANQVQRALDHLRSVGRGWLTVVHRAPDGTWVYQR